MQTHFLYQSHLIFYRIVQTNTSIYNAAGTESAEVVTRGDGTKALAVDTELVIDNATVKIENLFIASTDGAVTGADFIKMDAAFNLYNIEQPDPLTSAHTSATIAATTTLALAANANRKYALIQNDSDEIMYIKIGAAAVLNEGIRLAANGGAYEMSSKLGNLDRAAINGISTSGSKVLIVTEAV